MKRVLATLLIAMIVLPAFADKPVESAPGLEGQVVIAFTEGKPDQVLFKTVTTEVILLPCAKLDELLMVPGVAAKTFVLQGEVVASNDGTSQGFMIKSFEEKVVPAEDDEESSPTP